MLCIRWDLEVVIYYKLIEVGKTVDKTHYYQPELRNWQKLVIQQGVKSYGNITKLYPT